MANWLNTGSLRLSLSWLAIMHRRPEASTTIGAWMSVTQSSVIFTRTPTARSPSNRTVWTLAPWTTLAPSSWAWRMSSVSNTSRSTLYVNSWGAFGGGNSPSRRETNFPTGDRGAVQHAPG